MTAPQSTQATLEHAYDEHLDFDFFGLADSDFWDFGFWTPTTRTHEEACLNLLDLVTWRLPADAGSLLDVACGKGATTGYLVDAFPDADVVGINISAPQVADAARLVPEAEFLVMDATDLDFDGDSFDHIVSIEAAVHFDTRWEFFDEALRVLRPGGWLVMSDVLMEPWATLMPPGNEVAGPGAYEARLRSAGFDRVSVTDVTSHTWQALADRIAAHVENDPTADAAVRLAARRWVAWVDSTVRTYVLVAARKPGSGWPTARGIR